MACIGAPATRANAEVRGEKKKSLTYKHPNPALYSIALNRANCLNIHLNI